MKKYVKASKGTTEKLHLLMDLMMDEGVDEHEMLKYMMDNLPSLTVYNMMKDLAWDCGLDVNELVNTIEERYLVKRYIKASEFPSSVSFARSLVDAIKKQVSNDVTHNLMYNEICVHDIVNLRELISDVVDAVKSLGYDVYVPEFKDYVAVIKNNRYIRLFISDFLEVDNEYNGYIDINFKELNVDLADWD